jgi:hypothetical protein
MITFLNFPFRDLKPPEQFLAYQMEEAIGNEKEHR